jgi:hypothetical protein
MTAGIELASTASAPASATTGRVRVFFADGALDAINDAGARVGFETGELVTTTTTNATTVDLWTRVVPAGGAVMLQAHVIAVRDDGSAAAGRRVFALARRPTTGSAVLVGEDSTTMTISDASGVSIDVDVSASTNALRLRWTGLAAQTWEVRARVVFCVMT